MANYHVGCGITGIFAGTIDKTSTMWVNKSDVTDEIIVTNQECWKVVFNMTNVGKFRYDFLSSNSLFLQGKTDQVVYNFIHDSGLENQFLEFLKIEYGEQEILIQEENIINVFDKKENDEKKNRDNKSNFENDFKNQDFNDTFNGSFDKEKNDMELEKM